MGGREKTIGREPGVGGDMVYLKSPPGHCFLRGGTCEYIQDGISEKDSPKKNVRVTIFRPYAATFFSVFTSKKSVSSFRPKKDLG